MYDKIDVLYHKCEMGDLSSWQISAVKKAMRKAYRAGVKSCKSKNVPPKLCRCGSGLPASINKVACTACFADTGRP
jgi:hypothetical protein